ncbi:hypothetical protein L5515_002719 [Caenorhabditis briggsae]|uniref:C2H2-type domain-containing protein n=1 Tax=Caenorhabditis briggsae TaxID=6238 RepID=A0AAE9E6W1_CAEBR|nr:hypothetical protein L5515_002719 [Caenorhabditis briggsae]
MSYEDLKPVRFDYIYQQPQHHHHHQPNHQPAAPPPTTYYSTPYSHHQQQNATTEPYQPQYQMLESNGNGIHPPQMHHPPHMIHQNYPPPQHHQAVPPPIHQMPRFQYIMEDSDSQDSLDSRGTNQKYSTPVSTPARYSEDNDSEDLSEEVRNHWMPMTWCERSSDDPHVFNFVCLWGQCCNVFSSKEKFIDHLYGHIPSLEDTIQAGRFRNDESVNCKVRGCGAKVASIDDLNRHISMHVFQADCQQKGSEALIDKEEYVGIESCGFEPCTNLSYEGMVLTCQWEDCGTIFHSLPELFDHVAAHIEDCCDIDRVEQDFHNGEKRNAWPCKWTGCNHMSDCKSNLRRHARHHSGEKVLACPFCARFFSRRDKLYDHCVRRTILMSDPDIEDPYLCKLCQKRFGTERALCLHVTRHLVSHTCPLCSVAMESRSAIHRHLMTKHSRRSRDFKCTTCNKMFFTESELNRHAVYHTDVMYSCKHCPEKFKWKKQLLKHMKEHEENFNPTPYICHICDRSYSSGFALGRHLNRQHRLQVPIGFSRFTYKRCADGLMRLQTKKLFKSDATMPPSTSS